MPINDLIIELSNSNLDLAPDVIPMLWQASHHIPEQVIDLLLTALESSQEDYPKILNILLAECTPRYTVKVVEYHPFHIVDN